MTEICVLVISSADRGGAASIARQDAKSLSNSGLLVGYAPRDDYLLEDGLIQQHWLPFIKASGLMERLLRLTLGQITTFLGILFLVKKNHFQVVLNNVPHISKVCHFACRICGVKNVQVIHLPLSSFKAKKWMKPGDLNLSVTERGKRDLIDNWGVDETAVMVLPPTIQTNTVPDIVIRQNCERYLIRPERQAVACVALFNAQKNHVLLIDAWEKVIAQKPVAILLLAGDGPLYGAVKRLVEQKKLVQNVRFLGMVEPGWVYVRSLFCVLTSRDEGIPLVLLEAAAHRRAFIASDTGANREFITPDWNGVLVAPNNSQALADTILDLLQQPQKSRSLGIHAHERYLEFQSHLNRAEKLHQTLTQE